MFDIAVVGLGATGVSLIKQLQDAVLILICQSQKLPCLIRCKHLQEEKHSVRLI